MVRALVHAVKECALFSPAHFAIIFGCSRPRLGELKCGQGLAVGNALFKGGIALG